MKFSDGMEIDEDGPYRIEEKSDGLYVVGHGLICYVDTRAEGEQMIREVLEISLKNSRKAAKTPPNPDERAASDNR